LNAVSMPNNIGTFEQKSNEIKTFPKNKTIDDYFKKTPPP